MCTCGAARCRQRNLACESQFSFCSDFAVSKQPKMMNRQLILMFQIAS